LNLYLILIYFYLSISLDKLCEFCFKTNSKQFNINFTIDFLSLAVVIIPTDYLKFPSKRNVEPYLFSKSKDTPPILHNWKNEFDCLYESPKCRI